MIFDIDGIEEKLGYSFKDKMLLRKCFTHSSYAFEHGEESNELLEFFGDAIIEFVVTEYLYKNCAGDEGRLTDKRKDLVSRQPLLNAVYKLGLESYVLLGVGQARSAKKDDKLFSSIYESVVAGIYIDGGMTAVKKFVKDTIIANFEQKEKDKKQKKQGAEIKSKLQEYVQKNKLGSIGYETLYKKGPDHHPEFRVAVLLNGSRIAEGTGLSKRGAEAEAAKTALAKLRKDGKRR